MNRPHWRPHAAFYNDDWSIRPHGQAFIDLVHDTWATRATASTNHSGHALIRGFCGTYDVTVTTPNGQTQRASAQLARNGGRIRIAIGETKPAVAAAVDAVGMASAEAVPRNVAGCGMRGWDAAGRSFAGLLRISGSPAEFRSSRTASSRGACRKKGGPARRAPEHGR